MLYEMVYGVAPFKVSGGDRVDLFAKIADVSETIKFPRKPRRARHSSAWCGLLTAQATRKASGITRSHSHDILV